ncbi:class I adenylate-forming enzyme family protein [Streptomyces sp. CMB-StM0423]|uniref:class I adenylate-forming enzyme family protein n=1 Tax=Streptomyces sp. CMB-StM0423 TaxID=2059884 RepID=UPI000C70F306|nr:class I adenylate-forming enzyme family protein [Streptomyces sp. CMB-StM0423]AUH43248.1 long-chain acyl-CoA synthetase [Streptomyces sp. CMB-StM0423]
MPKNPRPKNIGLLFEHYAGAPAPEWHLDIPFSIAPDTRTHDATSLANLVADMSGRLKAAGLRRGDRVALVKNNHLDTIVLAAAVARIGALPAMITSTFDSETLARMMPRLEPKLLVASGDVLGAADRAGIKLVDKSTRVVCVDGAPDSPSGVTPLAEFAGADVPQPDIVDNSEPMLCTHTSGTTGVPKFVAHSANTLLGVLSKLETLRIPFLSTRPDDTIASCIAFVHSRAVTWTFAQFALPPAKAVVLSQADPSTVVETLSKHHPTTLEACPNIYQLWEHLIRTNPELFTNIRAYLSTFDAIHPSTVRAFMAATKRRGAVWGQSWGQSEIGPATLAVYPKRKVMRSEGSRGGPITNNVGRPIPFVTRIRVVDPETRKPKRRGQRGLVLIRTKGRCLTYLGEPERHREKDWDGWWNTGDIGVHTRSGSLEILDREVDSIPGMSSLELESLLIERLDAVTEAIVLGNPNGLPLPVISTYDGSPLDPQEWRRATADLPELDKPRVIPWEDFPRTGTWKVRRPQLRNRMLNSEETFGTGRWT